MKWVTILIIAILTCPLVLAKSGHMSLLTVSGTEHDQGDIADVYLEVRPGTGAVYIDSYPLTKLDTQISTRFANQIACDFVKEDCTGYDFFYTIKAKANIVGGPSAGAAIAVLTISVLENLNLDEKAVITGTINSGNLIGPVAGLDKKIDAAIKNGFSKVIIPKWQSDINITELERNNPGKKITIIKVKNLDEAVYYFTGEDFSEKNSSLEIPADYTNIMTEVTDILCNRSAEILLEIPTGESQRLNISRDFLNKSISAREQEEHYSAASYCFSANLRLRSLTLENRSQEELLAMYKETREGAKQLKEIIGKKDLKTLSDLETYVIVSERLKESDEYLDLVDEKNISYELVAYSKERLFSGFTWLKFFDLGGKRLDIDKDHLRTVCMKKSAEAEEMMSYVELYLPGMISQIKNEVLEANKNFKNEEYELCIFKSSKAKAQADILLTAITIRDEDLKTVVLEKFEAINNVLIEQQRKNMFPILGYSYYEYAQSLLDHDTVSSLTFAEYSLELSRLDLYFPLSSRFRINPGEWDMIKMFIFGFVAGGALIWLILLSIEQKKRFKNPGRFQENRNLPGKKR